MADDRPRNESGEYSDRLPPERALDVFDHRDDRARPVTAGDVMDALDVSRRTALNKLNELVAAGELDSRTVGARARVFWRPFPVDTDEWAKQLSSELGEPITVGETVYEDGDSHPAETLAEPESGVEATDRSESTPEDVSTALDALDLDADRREAVRAIYEHLRDAGTARKSDFTDEVYPDHSAGYQSPGGWWNALGKDALGELPDVKKPAEGRPQWRFTGG